jgi:hypothetical protein
MAKAGTLPTRELYRYFTDVFIMQTVLTKKMSGAIGGRRTGAGRPRKPDKDDYVQITCFLRKDTVAALRAGAGRGVTGTAQRGRFGKFLQAHLDRYPLPSHEEYLARIKGESVSMGPSPLLIRKEVNKFLRRQKEMEQKKIERRMRRMARKNE